MSIEVKNYTDKDGRHFIQGFLGEEEIIRIVNRGRGWSVDAVRAIPHDIEKAKIHSKCQTQCFELLESIEAKAGKAAA